MSRNKTVLLAEPGDHGWVLARARGRDRVLAQWRQSTLDAQIAAGLPTEEHRIRAVRAGTLTDPAQRRKLAAFWADLLDRSTGTALRARSWVPMQRTRVLAAEDDIRHLIALLAAAQPVPARGVAMANLLLTDGSGPIYDPRSRVDLQAAVQEAIVHLEPCSGFPASIG
jgi:hypothetical protein